MGLFDAIEQSAKASNSERVKTGLTDLNRRLQEQEATIQRLQQASRGPHIATESITAGTESIMAEQMAGIQQKLLEIASHGVSTDQFGEPFFAISKDIRNKNLTDAKPKVDKLDADIDRLYKQVVKH